jgi:hypothetical protein
VAMLYQWALPTRPPEPVETFAVGAKQCAAWGERCQRAGGWPRFTSPSFEWSVVCEGSLKIEDAP